MIGYIGNVDIANIVIEAEVVPTVVGGTRVEAKVMNIPHAATNKMKNLLSLLNSVYWTTAQEKEGAYNGYRLTSGEFIREVQVEFATGEVLQMSQYAGGIEPNGDMKFDIVIRGDVPDLGDVKTIALAPYKENYIQTGPGSIFAHSSRLFTVDGFSMPYAWNHTITYDVSLGEMPYLVQTLEARDLQVNELPGGDTDTLVYSLEAHISPGNPSNECPKGFNVDGTGAFCHDKDECAPTHSCSHSCHNWPGGFSCSCPRGFSLMSDAKTCQDIDECASGSANCLDGQDCLNLPGSFRCVPKCMDGFHRSGEGDICVDINECQETPSCCEHTCQNLVGSYRCSCQPGFTLEEGGKCSDVNECSQGNSPCSHSCNNTHGSYVCSCPPGFRLINGRSCRDINECYEGSHSCRNGEECVNIEGGHQCVQNCRSGYTRAANGQCEDVNECSTRQHRCYYNQRCVNTQGGYRCDCPKGFTSRGPGQPCRDRNECDLGSSVCQHNCTNTQGSYRCTCPPGYRLNSDGYSCSDINECIEQKVDCGDERMCFNQRGSYQCIDIPCPPDYARDPTTNFCVLECVDPLIECPPGAKYADVIEFRTVALAGGMPARQDLIRLSAFNQHDQFLPQTVFTVVENDPKLEFMIRPESGRGIIFTMSPLQDNSIYHVTVRARSYDNFRRNIQYQTTFIIHISVSAYPY